MTNDNNLCVFDFETNGLDTDTCDPVELACVLLDPYKLTVIPGSEFSSLMRPVNLDTVDDSEKKQSALKVSGITKEMLVNAPLAETVIKNFALHIKTFCGKKKAVPCGFNILNFDLPLYDRLCRNANISDKSGSNPSFLTSIVIDTKDCVNKWFYQSPDLHYVSMDSVRKLFGIPTEGVHRAAVDVSHESWLVIKFMRLYQNLQKKISFANSYEPL